MVYKRRQPPPKKPKGLGRPYLFTDLDKEKVRKLACRGWTEEEICDFFQIETVTWQNWKNENPEFFSSLIDWRKQYDERIEISLAESAMGYMHREDKVFMYNGLPVIVPTIKHYPPNPTSMIFWLKNRQRETWRDVYRQEVTGKNGGPIQTREVPPLVNLEDFTDEELLVIKKAGLKLNVRGKEEDGESE